MKKINAKGIILYLKNINKFRKKKAEKETEERISFFEGLRINQRGLALIRTLVPWNGLWTMAFTVTHVLFYYWDYFFLARLLDHMAAGEKKYVLISDAVFIVGGKVVVHIFTRFVDRYWFYSGSNLWELANAHLNRKIMEMDYEYVESESVHNMRRDIDTMARNTGGGINSLFWGTGPLARSLAFILISLGYTGYLFFQGRKAFPKYVGGYLFFFAGFLFVLGGLMYFTIRAGKEAEKKRLKKEEERFQYSRQYSFYTEEYINRQEMGKNIRMFHQQGLLSVHLERLYQKIFSIGDETMKIEIRKGQISSVLEVVMLGLIYLMLGVLVMKGAVTIGNVCLYAGCLSGLLLELGEGISAIVKFVNNTKYVKMYFEFLDMPSVKYQGTLPVEKRSDDRFTIEFRHVSFRYPGSDVDVLKDFSIKFHIGERLAVVGKNGSGKTTFIKLLCRLYDPTEGEILLNGIDIKKYDYREYLSLFSVVFQDFKIPAFSLGQNVAAAESYDEGRVKEDLERVGLSGLLASMPDGLDTYLYQDFDKNGVDISGGEAQKIAIARALYHDTPFVILDEPTASLDPLAEYEIYSKFDELVGTKTAVYISHRLSSCQFCDDILVIDGGKAVQRGSHERLVEEKEGLYYMLWHTQAQYYREGEGTV